MLNSLIHDKIFTAHCTTVVLSERQNGNTSVENEYSDTSPALYKRFSDEDGVYELS